MVIIPPPGSKVFTKGQGAHFRRPCEGGGTLGTVVLLLVINRKDRQFQECENNPSHCIKKPLALNNPISVKVSEVDGMR